MGNSAEEGRQLAALPLSTPPPFAYEGFTNRHQQQLTAKRETASILVKSAILVLITFLLQP